MMALTENVENWTENIGFSLILGAEYLEFEFTLENSLFKPSTIINCEISFKNILNLTKQNNKQKINK